MTEDEVIRMAREAGFATEEWGDGLRHVCVFNFQDSETDVTKELERFAALVAAAEREACANICETLELPDWPDKVRQPLAQAIRARGQA